MFGRPHAPGRIIGLYLVLYSIARFKLKEQGAKTTILFDHTGFPKGLGEHLASGWHQNYWEPLRKYLG